MELSAGALHFWASCRKGEADRKCKVYFISPLSAFSTLSTGHLKLHHWQCHLSRSPLNICSVIINQTAQHLSQTVITLPVNLHLIHLTAVYGPRTVTDNWVTFIPHKSINWSEVKVKHALLFLNCSVEGFRIIVILLRWFVNSREKILATRKIKAMIPKFADEVTFQYQSII